MKRLLIYILFLISPVLSAQEKFDISGHPRLLLREGEEAGITALVEKDASMKRVHDAIISECDEILGLPPVERVVKGRRLLHTSREALRRIFWLSYSYRMTGNETYAERAVQEMLAVCRFPDWNPSHFLDVGEMVMAVAIGYDWLYDKITPEERRFISQAIDEKGFQPAENEDQAWFYNADNNWNQVCCGGLLYGALATFEDRPERSSELIDLYVKSVPFALACYTPDGGYPEGFHYWGYGTSFQVMMIAALESALGTDMGLNASPGFLETSAFVRFMTAPSGISYNFSDALPYAPCNPMMFWFASRNGDMSGVWLEKKNIENLPDDFMDNVNRLFSEYRLLPALLIFCAGIDMDAVVPPSDNARLFTGKTPVFVYREGWNSPEDAYLGVKGGSPLTSHSHMDAGSFVYEYGGVRWSSELGMQDYHSLESVGVKLWDGQEGGQRWDVFRIGNESHSTLTINGKHHVVKSFVPITEIWEERGRKGARLDMTSAFGQDVTSAERSVWLDRRNHLHVEDRISAASEDVDVQWIMTTPAEAEIVSENEIVLKKDGRRMLLKVKDFKGSRLQMHIWSNEPPHSYDAPNPGTCRVGFTLKVPAGEEAVFETYLSDRSE
ncbi:MAG: heparinase II/III family protein [Bacteroidales bacterium]|nr:heparinase II/III family protein [Bacteroidales bacterium]